MIRIICWLLLLLVLMLLRLHLREQLLIALQLLLGSHATLSRTRHMTIWHLLVLLLLTGILHATALSILLLGEALHILLRHRPARLHLSLGNALSIDLRNREMAVFSGHW